MPVETHSVVGLETTERAVSEMPSASNVGGQPDHSRLERSAARATWLSALSALLSVLSSGLLVWYAARQERATYIANMSTKQMDVTLSYLEAIQNYRLAISHLPLYNITGQKNMTDGEIDGMDLSPVEDARHAYLATADRFSMIMPKKLADMANLASKVVIANNAILDAVKQKRDIASDTSLTLLPFRRQFPHLATFVRSSTGILKKLYRSIYVCSSFGFQAAGILLQDTVDKCPTYYPRSIDKKEIKPEEIEAELDDALPGQGFELGYGATDVIWSFDGSYVLDSKGKDAGNKATTPWGCEIPANPTPQSKP